jgi:PAS domain S-box-containing protein
MTGYSPEEIIGTLSFKDLIHPEDIQVLMRRIQERMEGKTEESNVFYRAIRKDGSLRDIEVYGMVIDYQGRPAVMGTLIDVTERKQAEEALWKSEENFRLSLDHSPLGVRIVNTEGETLYANQAVLDIYGYDSIEELKRIPVKERYTPQSYVEHKIRKKKRERGELGPSEYEISIVRKNGKVRHLQAFRKETLWSGVKEAQIIYQDITERKQIEEQILIANERLQYLLSSTSAVIYTAKPSGEYGTTFISENVAQMVGYNSEEFIRDLNFWFDHIHPEDQPIISREVPKIFEKKFHAYEYRFRCKDDRYIWMSDEMKLVRDKDGNPVEIIGFWLDISERKKAEEALRKSEERYKSLVENANEAIYVVQDGMLKFVNRAGVEIAGYSEQEITSKPFIEFIHPDDRAMVGERYLKRLRGEGSESRYTFRFITKNGDIKWLELGAALISFEGKPATLNVVTDITERKHAEEALRESEEKYRNILESIEDGYYEVDLAGNFIFFNDSTCRIFGYPQEEMMGMNNRQFTDKESAKKLFKAFNEVYRMGEPAKEFDWQIIRKDGTKRYIEVSVSLQKNSSGKPIGFRGVARDITERKRVEEELLRSEAKYRSVVENAQEGIFQSTAEGHHITVNQAFANILGYESPEEVMATITDIPHQIYVNPKDRKKILRLVEEHGSVKGYEAEFYRKDGSRIWVSINMHAVRDEQGNLLYYQGIDQDITEKKKMDAERQENIERLRKSLGATINAMAVTVETRDPYTAGHQRRVADLARAIAVEMNLKSEQIDGVRMASMIHDIGKISIPSEILTKPTLLTALEFNLIKTHPISGYNILKDIEFPWPIARIVLEHHERIDGSGYPNGLKGEQILLESKIIAIADVVEAISSHRPYRAAHGIEVALDEVTKNKGIIYDPEIVDACLRLFREKNYKLATR